jgi:hypothetical protein
MLSHGNIASNVVASLQRITVGVDDEYLSILPLCHAFERMVGHYTMLQAGAVISYATSFQTVVTELTEVRPTIVASVPTLYEKIYGRVVESATKSGGLQQRIFEWARAIADQQLDYVLPGGFGYGNDMCRVPGRPTRHGSEVQLLGGVKAFWVTKENEVMYGHDYRTVAQKGTYVHRAVEQVKAFA